MKNYTQRHLARIEKLNAQCMFLDFICQKTQPMSYGKTEVPVTATILPETIEQSDSEEEVVILRRDVSLAKEDAPAKRKIPVKNVFDQWARKVPEKKNETIVTDSSTIDDTKITDVFSINLNPW